jgi:hypothetical protein
LITRKESKAKELKTYGSRCKSVRKGGGEVKRNILTFLTAFVLFGLTLSSCSKESKDNSNLLTLPIRSDDGATLPSASDSLLPLTLTSPSGADENKPLKRVLSKQQEELLNVVENVTKTIKFVATGKDKEQCHKSDIFASLMSEFDLLFPGEYNEHSSGGWGPGI